MKRLAFVMVLALLVFRPAVALADSQLVGTWVLNGGEPRPSIYQPLTITRLLFRPNGKVVMGYLPPAPLLAHMLSQKEKAEAIAPRTDTVFYVDRGEFLEIASGSDLIKFKYEIRRSPSLELLLLTNPPEMGSVVKIYRRVK